MKNKLVDILKKRPMRSVLPTVGIVLVIILSVLLLWYGKANSLQSIPPKSVSVYFAGEYRIGDGKWQKIEKGKHISATKDVVTLRGNFYMVSPNGDELGIFKGGDHIAFYTNHINLTICETDREPYTIDNENSRIGRSACGINWTLYLFSNASQPIEIIVRNPHVYGNENAIDQMLSKTAVVSPFLKTEFEKSVLKSGAMQRNVGLAFIISSALFLGTALFSSLIHVKNSKMIWLLGLAILSAGLYVTYSSFGISFWNDLVVFNTSILGVSIMLYAFFFVGDNHYSPSKNKESWRYYKRNCRGNKRNIVYFTYGNENFFL